jgi:hypothetical protein
MIIKSLENGNYLIFAQLSGREALVIDLMATLANRRPIQLLLVQACERCE